MTLTATFLGNPDNDTDEFHAIRARGIGGSEIGAIVGTSAYESRFGLWQRKAGIIGGQRENVGMNWGKRLEDAVCQKFADDHPELTVSRSDGMYAHEDRPWQRANVDRIVRSADGRVLLLEAKTADKYDAYEWGKTGSQDVPPGYFDQVTWYLDVLTLPLAWCAVLIGGNDYREYPIEYDAGRAALLRAQGEQFWQSIQDGTPPAIDGSMHTYQAVRESHPLIERQEAVELDPLLHEQYEATKQAATDAADEHRRVKSTVLDLIGEAQYGDVLGEHVLRRQPGRGGSVSLYSVPTPKESAA